MARKTTTTSKKTSAAVRASAAKGLLGSGISIRPPLPTGSPFSPLEARLNDYALSTNPRGCLVTIRNACSPDREALIVGAGVHFWFYDVPEIGAVTTGDYMAGPVHVEVQPGATVPFRFSDWRRPVYKLAVGVRVMFGTPSGYPSAAYENYFWEITIPPLALIQPPPLYPQVGEIHLDLRLKREEAIVRKPILVPPGPAPLPPLGGVRWPPIPGPFGHPESTWFELAERPR